LIDMYYPGTPEYQVLLNTPNAIAYLWVEASTNSSLDKPRITRIAVMWIVVIHFIMPAHSLRVLCTQTRLDKQAQPLLLQSTIDLTV
jgi:hypothetical protein